MSEPYLRYIVSKLESAGIYLGSNYSETMKCYHQIKHYKRGKILATLKFYGYCKRYIEPFPKDTFNFFETLLGADFVGAGAIEIFRDSRLKDYRSVLFDTWFEYAKIAGVYNCVKIDESGYRYVGKDNMNFEKFAVAWGVAKDVSI